MAGSLMLVCDCCKDILFVPKQLELSLVKSEYLDCPTCGFWNEIDDDLRSYILETIEI